MENPGAGGGISLGGGAGLMEEIRRKCAEAGVKMQFGTRRGKNVLGWWVFELGGEWL